HSCFFATNAFTKDLFPEPYGAKARASLRGENLPKASKAIRESAFAFLTKRQRRAASDAGSATAKLTGGPNADTAPP
ncbi:MAG: hypothetical protein WA445_02650, partial [Pseudolabrys sp.]